MPLNKKIIFIPVFLLISTSVLSGCIIQDLLFGTSFDLTKFNITDSDGFPALELFFSASNKVTLKTYTTDLELIDTDYFYSDGNTTLNIGNYGENVGPCIYTLKVYDADNTDIYDKEFSVTGPFISIKSCNQRWWKKGDVYCLIGLEISVVNNGDAPFYPYSAKLVSGSETLASLILPDVVLPGSAKTIYSYIYHEDIFQSDTFTIEIFDKDNNTASTGSFSFNVDETVSSKYYHDSLFRNRLALPYPDFLHEYYLNLDRIYLDDYSLFVFDKYDDEYINLVLKLIISNLRFGELMFNHKDDVQKVEYITSFVQGLDYKKDSDSDESYEYPRYPIETLFNGDGGGGDCEDKAIFTASLLASLGIETALFRLPRHMAVGVKLGKDAVNGDYFIQDYDYLETTTPGYKCGDVPKDQDVSRSELTVYPIEDRPLLVHDWKDGVITTYKNIGQDDVVKVVSYTENLGAETAKDISVKGLFSIEGGVEFQPETTVLSELKPGDKKKTIMTITIPSTSTSKRFETRIYLDGELVDSEKSKYTFD